MEGGLKLYDEIIKIGEITSEVNGIKSILPRLIESNKDKPVEFLVNRSNESLSLQVTPHKFSGKGLLGYIRLC